MHIRIYIYIYIYIYTPFEENTCFLRRLRIHLIHDTKMP